MSKELIRLRNLCMAYDDELVLDNLNRSEEHTSELQSR